MFVGNQRLHEGVEVLETGRNVIVVVLESCQLHPNELHFDLSAEWQTTFALCSIDEHGRNGGESVHHLQALLGERLLGWGSLSNCSVFKGVQTATGDVSPICGGEGGQGCSLQPWGVTLLRAQRNS